MNLPWNRGVYIIQQDDALKIGASIDIKSRLQDAACWQPPGSATLLGVIFLDSKQDPIAVEGGIHRRLKDLDLWLEREWFRHSQLTIDILEDEGMTWVGRPL